MSLDIASSTMGAALGLKQAQGQFDLGVKLLSSTAEQQQQSITALLSPGAGGSVTETRGQNVNLVV
jgi:hypothetical protein